MAKLARLVALPLYGSFARLYGGLERVPPEILSPASHFRKIPRSGQHSTIVVAESDDGFRGLGEAFGLPRAMASACLVNDVIAPALVGEELGEPSAMLAALRAYFIAMGHTRGPAMEALSGVDIALWDLKARRQGKPLATLLGATPGPVDLYVSPVPFLPTPERSAAKALDYVAQGYRAIKLKVGRGIDVDLSHVAAVRAAIGSSRGLMLDVNCAYDVPTSIAFAKALKPYDLAWLEEPIRPDDPAALAEIRRAAPMPIAAGENEFTVEGYDSFLRAGAVDVLMPNISRAGGVSGILALSEPARRHGVRISPHGVGGGIAVSAALHVCRAVENCRLYEANRLPNALRDALPVPPLETVDGCLVAKDAPGHGCDLDWEQAETYRTDLPRSPG